MCRFRMPPKQPVQILQSLASLALDVIDFLFIAPGDARTWARRASNSASFFSRSAIMRKTRSRRSFVATSAFPSRSSFVQVGAPAWAAASARFDNLHFTHEADGGTAVEDAPKSVPSDGADGVVPIVDAKGRVLVIKTEDDALLKSIALPEIDKVARRIRRESNGQRGLAFFLEGAPESSCNDCLWRFYVGINWGSYRQLWKRIYVDAVAGDIHIEDIPGRGGIRCDIWRQNHHDVE